MLKLNQKALIRPTGHISVHMTAERLC